MARKETIQPYVATEQPVTLAMAGRADPQRTTDFQAVLLAMAGHASIGNSINYWGLFASMSIPGR
jgi:hypothetical protein